MYRSPPIIDEYPDEKTTRAVVNKMAEQAYSLPVTKVSAEKYWLQKDIEQRDVAFAALVITGLYPNADALYDYWAAESMIIVQTHIILTMEHK